MKKVEQDHDVIMFGVYVSVERWCDSMSLIITELSVVHEFIIHIYPTQKSTLNLPKQQKLITPTNVNFIIEEIGQLVYHSLQRNLVFLSVERKFISIITSSNCLLLITLLLV